MLTEDIKYEMLFMFHAGTGLDHHDTFGCAFIIAA